MERIQFGWDMPVGNREGTRGAYLVALRQGLQLIAGHFDSAWIADHLQFGTNEVLEGWTALTYLAALQPELRFGHLVLCQLFRNPAHLAKMAATFQYMSEGRLILGIGAGWHQEECDAYNIHFPSPGARVDELDEALQIMQLMWQSDHVSFEGKYHRVKDLNCQPKPDPLPPVMVAGFKPRMLRLVARYSDWWNVQGTDLAKITRQLQECDQACNAVGRDPATLKRTLQANCYCAPTEQELQALIGDKPINQGFTFVGTPDQILAQLRPFVDLGVNYFIFGCGGFPNLTTLETLTRDVLPRLNQL